MLVLHLERTFGHVIDILCLGLLLLRTWIFSGKQKLLAWVFSISFSAYIAALSWGTALFIMSYSKQSGEVCLNSLSAARHLIGVSTTGFSPLQVIDELAGYISKDGSRSFSPIN